MNDDDDDANMCNPVYERPNHWAVCKRLHVKWASTKWPEITMNNGSMAHHHFDESLDGGFAVLAAAPVPFVGLWSFDLALVVSFLIVFDDIVLKISKKIRPMLQVPLLFCCRAHFVHTFACRLRHIIDWFMCMMDDIVGAFANCISNLFDLEIPSNKKYKISNFVQT